MVTVSMATEDSQCCVSLLRNGVRGCRLIFANNSEKASGMYTPKASMNRRVWRKCLNPRYAVTDRTSRAVKENFRYHKMKRNATKTRPKKAMARFDSVAWLRIVIVEAHSVSSGRGMGMDV